MRCATGEYRTSMGFWRPVSRSSTERARRPPKRRPEPTASSGRAGMVYIEVEPGVRIHAQTVGAGSPVVLLHGWAFDHRVWDRQIRVLAEAGHSTIAVDLRGHGRSDRPYDGYALDQLARDVVCVITDLEIEPAVLIGWSLGGVTALRVALDAPQLLTKLVLVGSNGVATSRQEGYP